MSILVLAEVDVVRTSHSHHTIIPEQRIHPSTILIVERRKQVPLLIVSGGRPDERGRSSDTSHCTHLIDSRRSRAIGQRPAEQDVIRVARGVPNPVYPSPAPRVIGRRFESARHRPMT